MVLANDNFIGYTSDIITRYGVRWIEAAIVNPCWTNIMVYYVEGDHGHLMGEEIGKQQFRTVVRGTQPIGCFFDIFLFSQGGEGREGLGEVHFHWYWFWRQPAWVLWIQGLIGPRATLEL